ncbi:hypothetical protein LWI29_023237 [Acer saccharum]|uniref:Cytochrome P450 n=1 Tax=Acer saccharum TaxID=4024 RepID=A0AA39VYR7_ACESA|nr:hypothetical protein LWI29_023237 [Acer saccharum]
METSTAALLFSGLGTAIVIVIAWILMMVVEWVWLKPKKVEKWLRQQGFSGNSYRFLHGDMKDMSAMRIQATAKPISSGADSHGHHNIVPRILPFNHHIITVYGKKSFIWNGPTPMINITDPKMIREILFQYDIFQKPKTNPLAKLLVSGMAIYEGEQWFKARKIVSPAFHHHRLKDMFPSMYWSCNEMISEWKILVSNQNHNSTSHYELDVWPYIQTFTADVISRTAFSSSYEDGRKIFELIRQQIKHFTEITQFSYIPGWRFLPTATKRRKISNYNETRALIRGIINQRLEAIKVGEASKNNDDLLGMLIESNYKEIEEDHGRKKGGMSIEEVIEECKLFYLAGQETTASLLIWAMVLLCMHPSWQALAREEVFQVFGNHKPKFDDLNHLKLVTKILHETLRLYSPIPILNKTTYKETKLGEVSIPPGTGVSLPILMVHRDHEYWGDDAEEFNPDRFSQGVSKASSNNEVSFFPFSWGPRICIGQNFALMEAKLALAMVLQNFSFELSPDYVHAPTLGISVQPQYGAHLILHKI